jgi:hypothetical protein
MRSGYLVLACGLAAGCGIGLDSEGHPTSDAMPATERRGELGLGFCYAGNSQYSCDQAVPPPGTTTACCAPGGVGYCCPTGTSTCCPGTDTVLSHCCDAAHTCQITGSVTGNFDAYCVAAVCGGSAFNGLTQCCSPVSNQPVPKTPIANLADCPNRVANPNHTPTSNGCGTTDHPLPNHYDGAQFTPACNDHDICYDTCGNVKATCDQTFIAAMKAICDSTFPKMLQAMDKIACETLTSQLGRLAINSSFGVKAYDAAQMEACQCCP